MNLKQLYDAIDWTGVKALQTQRTYALDDPHKEQDHLTEYEYKFRCTLLEQALNGKEEDIMRTARGMLAMAGVWDQVIAICITQGFVEEKSSQKEENAQENPPQSLDAQEQS